MRNFLLSLLLGHTANARLLHDNRYPALREWWAKTTPVMVLDFKMLFN